MWQVNLTLVYGGAETGLMAWSPELAAGARWSG
jgi:hypothetical protein